MTINLVLIKLKNNKKNLIIQKLAVKNNPLSKND